ncbi:MAG: T9SS type A sorting domain-containing protein [Flavobacteriales bacterium]
MRSIFNLFLIRGRFGVGVIAFAPVLALAQTTPNPDCANAYPVAVSSGSVPDEWVASNTFGEANAITPPGCNGTGNRDVWFSFVATASVLTVVHDRGFAEITYIEVFSGTCGSLNSIGCTDGAAAANALPLTNLVIGDTYLFRIYRGSATSSATFRVGVVHPITNNECVAATVLVPSGDVNRNTMGLQATTIGATQSLPGCAVAGASDDDVWFRFTATSTKHTVVVVQEGDVVVQVYSGACGSLTSLWCEDDWVIEREIMDLTPGEDVYLRVHSASATPQQHTWFRIAISAPPGNDECADAQPLFVSDDAVASQLVAFDLVGATGSVVNDFPTVRDVWYRFTAPAGPFVLEKSATFNSAIFDAGCANGITATNSTVMDLDALVPGTVYNLKVGSSSTSTNSFRARGYTTNDDCAEAIPLPVLPADAIVDYTFAVTYGATESAPACATGTDDDVWFSFTATASALLLQAYAEGTSLRYELNTGICGSLVEVECGTVGLTAGTVLDSLVVGTLYRFRLWTAGSTPRPIKLALMEAYTNDECVHAIPLVPASLLDYDPQQRTAFQLATSSLPRCTSASATKDLWYTFTATAPTAAMVTQSSLNSDEVFTELFSGTCASLTSILCTDEPQINYSGLTVGETYFVRAYPDGGSPGFSHQFYTPPVNDNMAGAIQLFPDGNDFTHPMHPYANYGASMSFPQAACTGTPTNDVWFYFVATAPQHKVGVDVGNMNYAETSATLRIETFRGFSTIPDTLLANELVCGTSGNGINVTGLLAGDTVMVRLFNSNNGGQYSRTFHPWIGDGSNPDEASGATLIATYDAYSVSFATDGATQSLPSNDCGMIGDSADDDIWFKFIHDGEAATIICHFLDNNAVLELFAGAVGSLSPIACGYNHLILPPSLVDGQTYHFRVYSRNTSDLEGKLGIFHTPHPMESACADVDCLGPNLVTDPGIEQAGLHATRPPYTFDAAVPVGYTIAPGWHSAVATADSHSAGDDYDNDDRLPFRSTGNTQDLASDVRPRGGGGAAAVYARQGTDYHEAIGGKLTAPLVPGQPYLIAFNVHLKGTTGACDGFGAYLSMEPIAKAEPPFNPPMQMEWQGGPIGYESGWQNICGQFIADRPYAYITIGALRHVNDMVCIGASNYWYYIDDVTVAEVIDALCVTVDVEEVDPEFTAPATGDGLHVFPNPANDRLNISLDEAYFSEEAVIELFDAVGKRVHAEVVSSVASNVLLELPGSLREGLYLVMVRVDGQVPMSARVIIRR